jgi:hypothetical protein
MPTSRYSQLMIFFRLLRELWRMRYSRWLDDYTSLRRLLAPTSGMAGHYHGRGDHYEMTFKSESYRGGSRRVAGTDVAAVTARGCSHRYRHESGHTEPGDDASDTHTATRVASTLNSSCCRPWRKDHSRAEWTPWSGSRYYLRTTT